MTDKRFSWFVGGWFIACLVVPWQTAELCGSVLTGDREWMEAPVIATVFILCVSLEILLLALQETYKTCGPRQSWRDALPTTAGIVAAALPIGVAWVGPYAWHAWADGHHAWLIVPTYLVLFVVTLLDLALIQGLSSRSGGES